MSHDLSWTSNASSTTGEPRRIHYARRRLGVTSRGEVAEPGHIISSKFSGVRLAQDTCNSTFDIYCECGGVRFEPILSRDTKRSLVDKGSWP